MRAYRAEKKVDANGTVKLSALPFNEGEIVEVIVLPKQRTEPSQSLLKGKVVEYLDPTEPVASEDWDASR